MVHEQSNNVHSGPRKRKVIVDTDPGIDDAMALLYLHACNDIDLHSITTVFGNGGQAITARNAYYLVTRFGLDVPVIPGAERPLSGDRIVPELKVHGEDGFGDSNLSADHPMPPPGVPAWKWIANAVLESPGAISLLAIGPLTNLALALEYRPDIVDAIKEVVIMGGAFGTRGRTGNIVPHAEANFYYDAKAAEAVLRANWPVTAVGLDVSSDCILSSSQADDLPSRAGAAGQFLRDISKGYEAIYREYDGIDGFALHDVAAAVCFTNPDLFECQETALGVEIAGDLRGQSLKLQNKSRRTQRFCSEVDRAQVVEQFLKALSERFSSAPVPKKYQGTIEAQ
jgi:purine nucleosidase